MENWRKYSSMLMIEQQIERRNFRIANRSIISEAKKLNEVKDNPEKLLRVLENGERIFETIEGVFGKEEACGLIKENLRTLVESQGNDDPISHIFNRFMGGMTGGEQKEYQKKAESECLLSFSTDNKKLGHLKSITLSLPAGYSCPFAGDCKTYAVAKKGKDGKTKRSLKTTKDSKFSCFAAALEVRPSVSNKRWSNFELLSPKGLKRNVYYPEYKEKLVSLIKRSFAHHGTRSWDIFRFHDSGDFFRQEYFDAWLEVIESMPDKLFYGYTASLRYWSDRLKKIGKSKDYKGPMVDDLKNLNLIASWASKDKNLIKKNNLRYSKVIYFPEEAAKEKLPIDVNEFIAAFTGINFSLLLHNTSGQKIKTTIDPRTGEKVPLSKIAYKNNKIIKKMQEEQKSKLSEDFIARVVDEVLNKGVITDVFPEDPEEDSEEKENFPEEATTEVDDQTSADTANEEEEEEEDKVDDEK